MFEFDQHGASGAWVSELMPHTAKIVDQLSFIKSMHTEAINHDPAITFFQTGAQLAGRPSIGSWLSYGLGSENRDLPTFVVMVFQWRGRRGTAALRSDSGEADFSPPDTKGSSSARSATPSSICRIRRV